MPVKVPDSAEDFAQVSQLAADLAADHQPLSEDEETAYEAARRNLVAGNTDGNASADLAALEQG